MVKGKTPVILKVHGAYWHDYDLIGAWWWSTVGQTMLYQSLINENFCCHSLYGKTTLLDVMLINRNKLCNIKNDTANTATGQDCKTQIDRHWIYYFECPISVLATYLFYATPDDIHQCNVSQAWCHLMTAYYKGTISPSIWHTSRPYGAGDQWGKSKILWLWSKVKHPHLHTMYIQQDHCSASKYYDG